MSDRPDLGGPLAFFGYGLLALLLAAFLFFISPVRVDRLGGVSARQELEAEGVIKSPGDGADSAGRDPRELQTQSGGMLQVGKDEGAAGSPGAAGSSGDAGQAEGADGADTGVKADGDAQRPADDPNGFGLEPSRRADAVELCRLWMKDTPLFEETYGNGRRMGVGGTVLELREFGGDYIITLDGSGPQFKAGKVECYFDPEEMLPLRALRAGDQISVVGECSGGVKGPILKHSRLEGRL